MNESLPQGDDLWSSYSQQYIINDSESKNDYIFKDEIGSIFPFFPIINKDPIDWDKENKERNKSLKDNKEEEEEKPQHLKENAENSNKFVVKKIKRGPKKKKDNIITHKSDSSDNCLRKINVHYLSFIVLFLNDVLEKLQYKTKFYKLQYKFKTKINKTEFNSLKIKNIGQIISNNISDKYKFKDIEYNKKLFKKITNNKRNKVLENILSENYVELFKKIYFKSKNIINLVEYGLDKTFYLSNKVKMFKDLLLKCDTNSKSYYRNMLTCIKRNFIKDLIFLEIK